MPTDFKMETKKMISDVVPNRVSLSRWSTCMFLLAGIVALPLLGMAQSDQGPARKPAHGAGQSVQHAVSVPFEPVRRDKKGHVILPAPKINARPTEGVEHLLTPRARAEKALANSHKAPPITKPTPYVLPPGKVQAPPQPPSSGEQPKVNHKPKNSPADPPGADDPPENTFGGITYDGNIPPDVAMAAGPNQIVTAVNSTVNTYDKLGNLLGSSTFGTFSKGLGVISNWFSFDPVVHYDEYIQRFWLVFSARNNSTKQSGVIVALSNAADATPGWSLFFLDMTLDGSSRTSNWCDYPHFGLDTRAIYISCNMFNFPINPSTSFQYGKVRVMPKSEFLKDACCNWTDHWNLPFAVQPAIMRRAKDSDGEFLTDAQGGGASGDGLDVWHFPDPIGDSIRLDEATVGVSGYFTPPNARQPNPNPIDTVDARLLFAVWQGGHLSTGQNTACNGNNSCAAFYELNVSGFPSVSVVNDWAMAGNGIDYYYPAVDEDSSSFKSMVYTTSSPSSFASPAWVEIPPSNECSPCVSPQELLRQSSAVYVKLDNNQRNRWGDYLSASADPDGLGIWIAGEFVPSANQWAVQVSATYNTYAPGISVSPTKVNFGDNQSGNSWERDVQLTNSGNADLTISSIQLVGSSDYSTTFDNCLDGGGVLEAKQNCTVKVGFKPTGSGEKQATLRICTSLWNPCNVPVVVTTFTFDGPVITKVSPNNGTLAGEMVTVDGDALGDKLNFDFGGSPATEVSCATSTACTMVAPSHGPGTVDVIAARGSLNSAVSPNDHFTYQAPAITGISPSTGPTAGGQWVNLTGVGFDSQMTVKFGNTTVATNNFNTALNMVCPSSIFCFVPSPPGTGQVQITATLAGVTSNETPADLYTYAVFPSVTDLSPANGPVTGGISVTITGTNFSTAPDGTTFQFGPLAATNVTCASSTQCTVTAPVREASAGFLEVPVTATVNGFTSVTNFDFLFGTAPPPPIKH
jgi:hypothetical protein